jgi:hypothetical protein
MYIVCLARAGTVGRFLFMFSVSEFIHLCPMYANSPAPEIDTPSPKENAYFLENRSGCFD